MPQTTHNAPIIQDLYLLQSHVSGAAITDHIFANIQQTASHSLTYHGTSFGVLNGSSPPVCLLSTTPRLYARPLRIKFS